MFMFVQVQLCWITRGNVLSLVWPNLNYDHCAVVKQQHLQKSNIGQVGANINGLQ